MPWTSFNPVTKRSPTLTPVLVPLHRLVPPPILLRLVLPPTLLPILPPTPIATVAGRSQGHG